MIIIFGKNVTYVDRGILVDRYHYKYGEEKTLFIFEDSSEKTESHISNEIYYFSGIITDVNEEHIKFESIIRNDYIKEGEEAEILLINSPQISFNFKADNETDKAKIKVGQVIEANVVEVRKGTYPLELIAEDIIVSKPMNSMAAAY